MAHAITRLTGHLNRGPETAVMVRAFVRPWDEILEEAGEPRGGLERRWAAGIDFEDTYRLRVGPLVSAVGETAAGAILHRLVAHTPLYVAGAGDLDWIIEGWRDAEEDTETAEEAVRSRAVDACALAQRIERIVDAGARTPCSVVPGRTLRRLVNALCALDTPQPLDNSAWRETAGADWATVRPVVQFVWDDGCPLDHAADEAEWLHDQEGSFPQPQLMWLIDPGAPHSKQAWRRWLLALRQVRAASRVIGAIEELSFHTDSE